MSPDKSSPADLWQRFNELATMPSTEREEVYRQDGLSFILLLFASFMKGSAMPEIDCAEDFSDFIVESRENYRLWNQRLMSLMIASETDLQESDTGLLCDFVVTCPWTELVDAAKDFIDSTS